MDSEFIIFTSEKNIVSMKKNINATPHSMNINVMKQMLMNYMQDNDLFYASKEFAVSNGANFFGQVLTMSDGGPFFVEDYRIGYLVEGELDANVNLIDYHITSGTMVFIGRGSIAHIHNVSKGAVVKGFILSADMVSQIVSSNQMPLLSSSATAFKHESSSDDRAFFENILHTVWSLIHTEKYPVEVLRSLVLAILNYFNNLHVISNNLSQNSSGLFNQFIALVNQYSDRERSISFYSDKLCLSPRYFSTLIMEQSGKTAKHWIDAAVVTRAKVMLRHTPKTISQISAELNFPNDSFFCKFFRRLTGTSPSEYRGEHI